MALLTIVRQIMHVLDTTVESVEIAYATIAKRLIDGKVWLQPGGRVYIADLGYPTFDGPAGSVITTDGNGNLELLPLAGGGPPGPQGEPGPVGPQGPEGPTGPPGSLQYLGDYIDPPPPEVYNDGDIVVAEDGIAYICVKDGTITPPEPWPGVGIATAVGPPGPQGDPGTDGIDGTNGATGAVGPMGPAGPQGPQGIQGPQGPQGPAGSSSGVPSGMVAMFMTACPPGWHLVTETIGRFPRGNYGGGGMGGSDSHAHATEAHGHSVDDHTHHLANHVHALPDHVHGNGEHSHGFDYGGVTDPAGGFSVLSDQSNIGGEMADRGGDNVPVAHINHAHVVNVGDHQHGFAGSGTTHGAGAQDTVGVSGGPGQTGGAGGQTGGAAPGTSAAAPNTDVRSHLPPYLDVVFCMKD
jgi:hypothetical protein